MLSVDDDGDADAADVVEAPEGADAPEVAEATESAEVMASAVARGRSEASHVPRA